MIDIIIPVYNNSIGLRNTLLSIGDKEVCKITIIDDNSDINYSNILQEFSEIYNIQYFKLPENRGPGYARQFGIEHTNNNYIYFLDAGDEFAGHHILPTLTQLATKAKPAIIAGEFLFYLNEKDYEIYTGDNFLLKGKLFSRKFLNKYQIKFFTDKKDSYCDEDMAFVDICFMIARYFHEFILFETIIFELDMYNPDSLSNKEYDKFYFYLCPQAYYNNYIKIKQILLNNKISNDGIIQYSHVVFFRFMDFLQKARNENKSNKYVKEYFYKFLNISELEKRNLLIFYRDKHLYLNLLSW